MSALVLNLADRRPIYDLPRDLVPALEATLPATWQVRSIEALADGTGDGGGEPDPSTLEAVRDAEIYMGFGVHPAILRAGAGLRWVHSGTAGVGSSLTPEMLAHEAVFTNSAGTHGPPMAETVIGYILHFARGFDFALEGQGRGSWWKEPFDVAGAPVREVAGSTVGIIGLGGVGREVADRARALGARVLGLKRSPARIEGVEVVTGAAGLDRVLLESDYLVLTAPETPETRGLIDAAALARMKPDAVLINVARGALIDDAALLGALEEGRLRGAALDVFAIEPLPDGHPFWSAPNLLVTPHVSAYTPRFWEREAALILDNVRRYLEGMPLRNVVDKRAGY